MSNRNQFSRGAKDYRRGKPRFPESGKSFLIVTEGEKTEPNYFNALRNRLQLNATEVEIIHPDGTDPITIVKKAAQLITIRKQESKKGSKIPYDEVWVIFDLEQPHDERRELAMRAKASKDAIGLNFGLSDPCFEFWLLLHFEYTTAQFQNCASVKMRLERHWVGYTKGGVPDGKLFENLPQAVINAQTCRRHHIETRGDGNPGTNIDELIIKLNLATREHLRIIK